MRIPPIVCDHSSSIVIRCPTLTVGILTFMNRILILKKGFITSVLDLAVPLKKQDLLVQLSGMQAAAWYVKILKAIAYYVNSHLSLISCHN